VAEIAGEQRGTRRHAQRNHELLVAAAHDVFAERGVEAPLEEVARRAGVGIGTLYRHFATREALIETLFERRIGELTALAEAAAAEPDGWQALVRFLEQTLELQASDRLLKDVLMRYPAAPSRVASARAEMRRLFEQVLERARDEGTLRADFTLADLALLFWSFTPLIDATAAAAPSAWRRHLHWLLDGLRRAAATPQAEPPLSDDALHAAMQALREQRLGRRHPRTAAAAKEAGL
jgi:AcrR family transcriptional regulator